MGARVNEDLRPAVASRAARWTWPTALTGLAGFSLLLGFWRLQDVARMEYYAAAALSMSQSPHNFFFGSVDPGGLLALDKIPGSLWIPALAVRILGFSTWTITAPNALATAATVVVVAIVARRCFGTLAGVLAGLICFATPILWAVGRSNQPQSLFVLLLALTLWAGVSAIIGSSFRWLLGAALLTGLAFWVYMAEAWALWPAVAAAYLAARTRTLRAPTGGAGLGRGVAEVAGATLVTLAVSMSWVIAVWLTPAASRPYVGSTIHNDPLEMVFGYNALGRFGLTSGSNDYWSFTSPFSGKAGFLRLFNDQVGAQIAWLLPATLIAVVVLWRLGTRRSLLVLLGGWLLTMIVMFSAVAGMHQFYTAALVVPVGVLLGGATARLLGRAVEGGLAAEERAGALTWLAALVVLCGWTASVIGARSPAYLSWAPRAQGTIAVLVALGLGGLAAHQLMTGRRMPRGLDRLAMRSVLGALVMLSLLLTPVAWSVDTIHHTNSVDPVAGDGSAALGAGALPTEPTSVTVALLDYVRAHGGGARFLVASYGIQNPWIVTAAGGDPVVPIGGITGRDPVPTFARFRSMIDRGDLRFVLLAGTREQGFGYASNAGEDALRIGEWVTAHCTAVDFDALMLYRCG